MKLLIETPYGDKYRIEENGDIVRLDIPGFSASDKWKMIGLVPTSGAFRLIPHADITAEWLAENPLLFKNGKPRYTVRDLDHGTVREWGNTDYHGVKTIRPA